MIAGCTHRTGSPRLYPTHDEYVQNRKPPTRAVAAGYMLQSDRDIAVDQAKKAPIP